MRGQVGHHLAGVASVHRFSADELEAAVGAAMIEFYTTRHDVINEAVADAQTAPRPGHQPPP